jgi:hypothetical protein
VALLAAAAAARNPASEAASNPPSPDPTAPIALASTAAVVSAREAALLACSIRRRPLTEPLEPPLVEAAAEAALAEEEEEEAEAEDTVTSKPTTSAGAASLTAAEVTRTSLGCTGCPLWLSSAATAARNASASAEAASLRRDERNSPPVPSPAGMASLTTEDTTARSTRRTCHPREGENALRWWNGRRGWKANVDVC